MFTQGKKSKVTDNVLIACINIERMVIIIVNILRHVFKNLIPVVQYETWLNTTLAVSKIMHLV